MSAAASKSVKLLLADDNPLIRDLVTKSLEPFCEVLIAADGADALLRVIDDPPDVILCDYKMPGLDGRQLFDKLRGREATRHIPFLFMASRTDIEEKLRPLVDGVEDFIAKPFLAKDLVRLAKKIVDRLHLEKLQKRASRPGVIQGRLEEMSMIDLMQSLEMGSEILPPGGAKERRERRTLFRQRAVPRRENWHADWRRSRLQSSAVDRRRVRDRFQRRQHFLQYHHHAHHHRPADGSYAPDG